MSIDTEKIDDVVLALLTLTMFETDGVTRAWKGHAFAVMDRLYEKGWILDPKGKAKSVVLTEDGAARARELFSRYFGTVEEAD